MSIFDYILQGNEEEVRKFLNKQEENKNSRNKEGIPILALAAANNQQDIVNLLLKNGADVNALTSNALQENVFLYASYSGNRAILECLFVSGAKIDYKNTQGKTALDIAVEKGHTEVVAWLLDRPCFEIDQADLLYIASAKGYLEIVKILFNASTNTIECRNIALSHALENNRISVVKFLLEMSAKKLPKLDHKLKVAKELIEHCKAMVKTNYGDFQLRENKILALNSLIDNLINKENSNKSITELITEWKKGHTAILNVDNETLIATHRRRPDDYSLFGFFVKHYNQNCATKTQELLSSLIAIENVSSNAL